METKCLLPRMWDVPQVFRDRLGTSVGRQRMMTADGHLLLVLHLPPNPDQTERLGRFLWRKPGGTWMSNDLGGGSQAVAKHLDQFTKAIQDCDIREERAKTAEDYFAVLERLAPILRTARNLHAVFQEARQACPDDREMINFRDRAYEIERTAELLQAETKHSWDLLMAKKAEEQAKASRRMAASAHRLNLLAAFFFPIASLSGILGVNLAHGWERSPPPLPFLAFVATGVIAGLILMAFVARAHRN